MQQRVIAIVCLAQFSLQVYTRKIWKIFKNFEKLGRGEDKFVFFIVHLAENLEKFRTNLKTNLKITWRNFQKF